MRLSIVLFNNDNSTTPKADGCCKGDLNGRCCTNCEGGNKTSHYALALFASLGAGLKAVMATLAHFGVPFATHATAVTVTSIAAPALIALGAILFGYLTMTSGNMAPKEI